MEDRRGEITRALYGFAFGPLTFLWTRMESASNCAIQLQFGLSPLNAQFENPETLISVV